MPIAELERLNIYYERGGAGDPLFFITGSGSDLRNKPNHFDSPLAQAFQILSYDQRGLGQTQNPAGDFSMAQYADDAAALLDHLEIDKIPLMGVSFGGMVGLEFLIRHPSRVSAAVLACTSAGGEGGASFPLHELQGLAPEERAAAHLKVADVRHTDEWIAQNPDSWRKRMELSMAGQRADRNEEGARKQLEARRYHDVYDRLGEIKVPVLILYPEQDIFFSRAQQDELLTLLPDATLKVYPGAGHGLQWEFPEEFGRDVSAFVGRLASG